MQTVLIQEPPEPDLLVLDAGVDWVTLTAPTFFSPDGPEAAALRNLLRRDWYGGQAGVDVEVWGWSGYSGLKFGPLAMGARRDGSIVRCSGPASRLLTSVPWAAGWKCTRLDLQITARVPTGDVDAYITALKGGAVAARAGANGRPWKVAHIAGMGDGDTLLMGARSSALYARVYNKYAESGFEGDYIGAVRFEIEVKNGVADRLWWKLSGQSGNTVLAQELVVAAMHSRGVYPAIDIRPAPEEWLRTVSRETDADRQLLWLEKSVSGIVRKLRAQGLESEVDKALGITDRQGGIDLF
jgi:hypothetical protein